MTRGEATLANRRRGGATGDRRARVRSAARKGWTLMRSGPHRQALVAEAAARMLAARVAILLRPSNRVARGLGDLVHPADPRATAPRPLDRDTLRIVREVGWAVRAAAPYMPFRSVCLQQAMAARVMLRRRGIASVMHLGAGRDAADVLVSHAWLSVGRRGVTGYPVAAYLTELSCFV